MAWALSRKSRVDPVPDARTANFIAYLLPALIVFANLNAYGGDPLPAHLVQNIVFNDQIASDHLTWHNQAFKINELKHQLFSEKYSQTERCQALSTLKNTELVTFYDEISSLSRPELSNCQVALANRLENFFNRKKQNLDLTYRQIAKIKLRQCSDKKSDAFGPELEKFVDPKKGGVLSGDDYSPCNISITIDDGPHKQLTPKILEVFASENVHVNFFVVGQMVAANRDLLRAEYADGHIIGNHSMTHPNMQGISFRAATEEIEQNYDLIMDTIYGHLMVRTCLERCLAFNVSERTGISIRRTGEYRDPRMGHSVRNQDLFTLWVPVHSAGGSEACWCDIFGSAADIADGGYIALSRSGVNGG